MLLMSIPVAVLLGISFYFTINNIQQKTENDSLGTVIEQSRQFANVIHNLQKERDMSVLYLTGGCTKLPVIESYQKTSQALSKLSTWPVNSIKDFAEEFANREMFRQHLILHHKVLDLPDQNAYMEIQFYSRSINMMMTWLYDAIKKSNLGKTWTTIVSYLEIVGCTEYAGQMRSLGIIYFSPKGFSDHRAYGHFNKVSWPTRVNYELARRYSPLVMTLDLKQQMDSFSGYDLFGVINAYTYIIQNRAAGQIDDEHFWYSNMTNFINAMATVQGKLASELIEQFESRTFWIVVTIVTRAFLIVLVVAVSPVFLSRVYTIVCSIHENTHNSIGVTSSINRNRDRVESLFSVICTPKVVRLAIKKKTPKPAYFDHVTVMCVEVANFRQQAVRLHVLEVIACLDELVALLATKTALYGDIYRIQTAGHTLMVVAGVSGDDGSDEDHAKHVVSLALDILDETKNRNYKCSSYRKICVRIAVHTGECVSGMWIGRALTTSVTGAAVSHASDILGHAEGKYTTHYRVNTSLTIPLPVLYHQVKHDCCGCRECNVISIVF
ncbi:hypothetical protein NP493_404g00007 [Ridgeia piscesae]|uniref:Guanylate cyclase domain-containing protein n=1 Tax=Ridgeia piscesae TaxID=27915 RepID=A0AAD9NVI8_RIDPI|nr:hypothetical protein NP493_404g00007 [Ridgeia piscesae]